MVHLFDKSDQLYQRKDPKKLRIEEYSSEVSFKYGVPMIILDLINALTGAEMIAHAKKEIDKKTYVTRLNPDNDEFIIYKLDVLDEFVDKPFQIFCDLGELDLADI
jgi:hypothetical protein